MTIASGARSQVAYIAETTFGTIPTSPVALVKLPFITWNVNMTTDEFDDLSIQADRQQRYSVTGNRHVTGDVDVNYEPLNYDAFLESLCFSSFATNTLKIGQTPKSFTIEEGALDVIQYRVYTGVMVDKFTLTVPNSGIVTGKFSLIGKDQSALTATSIDTDGTVTAAASARPVTHVGASGFFKLGGNAVGYISNLTLSVDNACGQNFGLGVATARSFSPSFAKVTGTADIFFEDAVAYNLFVNGTASSIDFKLDNGTNTHEYLLPNVKLVGASKSISGQGPVSMQVQFKALYDATAGSSLVITRT